MLLSKVRFERYTWERRQAEAQPPMSEQSLNSCLPSTLSVWLRSILGVLSISLMPVFFACPAFGAERIVLSYGILERSLSIDALETYAKTGDVDRDLAVYAQYANAKQLTRLRQVLLTRIPLNAVEVSQFLYTPIGERLLERLGEVIQPGSGQSGFRAIRAH